MCGASRIAAKGRALASRSPGKTDKLAAHWRRLALSPDAPACVIKVAHRYFIEIHHPDREGGSLAAAQEINVAYDELKERGAAANEHVARFYEGEPFHVLGLTANADSRLAERAGKALASELESHPRLAERVGWAVANFGRAVAGGGASRPRVKAATPPPPRRQAPKPAPRPPSKPGLPDGLPERIDLGTLAWASAVTRDLRLTWSANAPYTVNAECETPLIAQVKDSKAVPGRFVVTLGIDWNSPELRADPKVRGYTLDSRMTLTWGGGGTADVRVRGILHYPAMITASPLTLDLGTVQLGEPVRTSLILISSAAAEATIESSAWLSRVDAAGRPVEGPVKLAANTPLRIGFVVDWDPITERASGVAAGKPVRPTGKVTVRWNQNELEVPAQIVAQRHA